MMPQTGSCTNDMLLSPMIRLSHRLSGWIALHMRAQMNIKLYITSLFKLHSMFLFLNDCIGETYAMHAVSSSSLYAAFVTHFPINEEVSF